MDEGQDILDLPQHHKLFTWCLTTHFLLKGIRGWIELAQDRA
jgi:hypothetical protein